MTEGQQRWNEVQTKGPIWEEDTFRSSGVLQISNVFDINAEPNRFYELCAKSNMKHMSSISFWQRKQGDGEWRGTIERMFETKNKGSETWTCVLCLMSKPSGNTEKQPQTFKKLVSWTQVTSMLGTFTHPYHYFQALSRTGRSLLYMQYRAFPQGASEWCVAVLSPYSHLFSMQVGGIHAGHF